MCRKFSRRDFLLQSGFLGLSLGAAPFVRPMSALADGPGGAGSFRVCINLELLGGMDNFSLWLPRDGARFSALQGVRPGAMFVDNPNDGIFFNTVTMNPALEPLLSQHASKLKIVPNSSNALNSGQTGSHELAQNVMTLGTRNGGGQLKGWKAHLFDNQQDLNLIGFAGSKGANFNCDKTQTRCRETPPMISDTFENFTLSGVNFNYSLGGANNTTHVAEAIERLAQTEVSRDVAGLELTARSSLKGTFPAIQSINDTITNYQTPLHDHYPDNALAKRLRNIAMKIRQLRDTQSNERIMIALGQGGFDLHTDWFTRNNNLAAHLGLAISTFLSDLDAMGVAENVVMFTSTDFGRNNYWNGSGTDHGIASTTFVLGGAINSGVHGDLPSVNNLANDRTPPSLYDNRALISQILNEFMGIDHTKAYPGAIADEFELTDFDLFRPGTILA